MKLGNILETASEPVVYREIAFQVLGQDATGKQVRAKAIACLAFVSEDARAEANRLADLSLRPGASPAAETLYWFLLSALREKGNEAAQFCPNEDIGRFRAALIMEQVTWLKAEYDRYVKDEYPEIPTEKQKDQLLQEAAGK